MIRSTLLAQYYTGNQNFLMLPIELHSPVISCLHLEYKSGKTCFATGNLGKYTIHIRKIFSYSLQKKSVGTASRPYRDMSSINNKTKYGYTAKKLHYD